MLPRFAVSAEARKWGQKLAKTPDYSGAETPEASHKGLRVYCAVGESAADEVPPPPSPRKYWTRRGIAHWLAARLAKDVPTVVGIDHGFSFPLLQRRKNRDMFVDVGDGGNSPSVAFIVLYELGGPYQALEPLLLKLPEHCGDT